MKIAIYCGSSFGNDKIYKEKAKDIIEFLKDKDISIIYGGSESGLMGTISNEALNKNLQVHGVITEELASKEILNNSITTIHIVENIRERKAKMEELSDAFLALPGGYGTLEEISEVFTSIQLGSHNKPCALYNVNGYFDNLIEFLQSCVSKGFIKQIHLDAIIISDDIKLIYEAFKNYNAPKNKWQLS